jgi:hypothetical protein
MKMGYLYPCFVQEVVPGDRFHVSTESLVRFAPMIAPMMHSVDFRVHYFYVPNRVVWSRWDEFLTGYAEGATQPTDPPPLPPYFRNGLSGPMTLPAGTLPDYLGLPTETDSFIGNSYAFSQLPFRVYRQIYNDWYRDENLISADVTLPITWSDELNYNDVAGTAPFSLSRGSWKKDYFTSALPWTQKGGDVVFPLGNTVPVKPNPSYAHAAMDPDKYYDVESGTELGDGLNMMYQYNGMGQSGQFIGVSPSGQNYQAAAHKPRADKYLADLSAATSISVNDLREAFQLQRFLEKDARAGTRITEYILAHFGVRVPDSRVQRAEYLGGVSTPVVVSEVLQTSATTQATNESNTTPQGNMAGHALSAGVFKGFKKGFLEHGYVMGICSCMPKPSYLCGVDRSWTRQSRFDYYWPDFATLGEQPVLNKEVRSRGTGDDTSVFGYQSRYAEYRYAKSTVHGDMRTNLSYWHMSRDSEDPGIVSPALSKKFIECNPTTRTFAVEDQDVDNVYVQMFHKVSAVRPMPKFGNPSII